MWLILVAFFHYLYKSQAVPYAYDRRPSRLRERQMCTEVIKKCIVFLKRDLSDKCKEVYNGNK